MKTKILFLAVFLPISVIAGAHFKDTINSPFRSYIDKSAEYGIISGYGNGIFKPNNTVSFVESLKIIINAGPKKSQITTKTSEHWSVPFKKFYQKNQATNLVRFSDNEAITRDFAMYLLLRQLDIKFSVDDYDKIPTKFPDINKRTPFAPYLNFSKEVGITNGFSDGTFGAKKHVTRGELTKMAYNTLIEKREEILQKYEELIDFHSASAEEKVSPINTNTPTFTPKLSTPQEHASPKNTTSGSKTVLVNSSQVLPLSKVKTMVKNQVYMQEDVLYLAASDPEKIDILINKQTKEKFFPRVNFSEYTLFYTQNGGEILSKNTNFLELPAVNKKMVELINNFRTKNNLPLVKLHPKLQKVAQNYAKEMYDTKHFDHISLAGEDVMIRVLKGHYQPLGVAENIAYKQVSVEEAMQSFIDSPPHRANMLHAETIDVGVGFYGNYWVQIFAMADE